MVAKLDSYLQFNEKALNLRAERQQILASNITNADTPNYKARDIDFSKALQNAMTPPANTLPPVEMTRTSSAHYAGKPTGDGSIDGSPLLYRPSAQGSIDGNTVDMNVETTQFADNAIRYEAAVTAVSGQIKTLTSAIQPG
ncbi:flagellar basal body rod protein FlgB [Herbaspirillum sp. RTI4]|uniref:flagellar basal body rod protein FlgB n=1 Tax=Herbaspirillum sp. RTI4 TaxID=3048640 RepID=UPI002AB48E5A|nr:flagellar basal body rod protein FlgB [Herbaspirillum sp. RTI4]MDY7578296.1 flagellar basal body rod protein FlgB [Herbaspirillum sp. RTI4]MEA9981211.1 flagellar basal body rod protein FlgB [Herbaspirillum sp. RTI4]